MSGHWEGVCWVMFSHHVGGSWLPEICMFGRGCVFTDVCTLAGFLLTDICTLGGGCVLADVCTLGGWSLCPYV